MTLGDPVNYSELMEIFSKPRPNGSAALQETKRALLAWLDRQNIPYTLKPFRIYPYFFECIGLWLILSRTLLAWAVWRRWGWLTLLIALAGLIGGIADVALHWPLVTWFGSRIDENILIEFAPNNPRQEIILSAHYDSKTELLDHRQRMFFLKNLRVGMLLSLLIGALGLLDSGFFARGGPESDGFHWLALVLCVPLLFLAWGLGLNLSVGRLLQPSQGAVDNGAACAILLGLAARIAREAIATDHIRVTLALFSGEEVNMQGSRAYVREREWSMPAKAVNLEVMAQDGEYVYWERDGYSLRLVPTAEPLNQSVIQAITKVTGRPPIAAGPVNSDGYSFLAKGIPTATIGTYDRRLRDTGFHRPTDHLNRVVMARLEQGVEILSQLLRDTG